MVEHLQSGDQTSSWRFSMGSHATINTLYNVCSVHRGVFSTLGDTMSTSGDTMSTSGISWVHRGVFSTSEGYHEYIGEISWVHRGDIMIHVRDTMSKSEDVQYIGGYHEYIGRYHEYIRGCSVHWGMFSTSEFSIEIERILSSCSPTCIMISLRCTHDILLMYSWYPPMYWTSPMYSWYPLDVLMISPRCTHDIPRCTEHSSMYWTSPDVLNTHYTGWLSKIGRMTTRKGSLFVLSRNHYPERASVLDFKDAAPRFGFRSIYRNTCLHLITFFSNCYFCF